MIRELKISGVKWVDAVNLSKEGISTFLEDYNFHELDIEACLEWNQRARIDSYDDYFFMVFYFPRYNQRTKIYDLNEFNIFLWRDFLITLRDNHTWWYIDSIFDKYSSKATIRELKADDEEFKLYSGFILYEIILAMLVKMFKISDKIGKDLRITEKAVFDTTDYSLVKEIMIKKRNIVVLKNMFIPQVSVMKLVEFNVNKLFAWEIEEYFEDLEDKLEHIVADIKTLEEYVVTIEDAFTTIIDIKTNKVITFLSIFSAFMLPLTLITSFYWMNIDLPFQKEPYFVFILLIITIVSMIIWYIYYKRKDSI